MRAAMPTSAMMGMYTEIMMVMLKTIGRATSSALLRMISAASFVGIFFLSVPFPAIVISALGIGLVFGRRHPEVFNAGGGHGGPDAGAYVVSDDVSPMIPAPTLSGTVAKVAVWLVVWLLPLLLCFSWLGGAHVLTRESVFFSKAALVTFGGAYAVLPYVAQQAVEIHGWLSPVQMMDGLGLAETTPGPLVLVLQFVGFVGGWNAPGDFSPLQMAALAAGVTSWATFIPGYLFIFAGAPFIERSRGNTRLNTALSAVTAAVVGVILNLAVWFAWHVLVSASGKFDLIPLVLGAGLLLLIRKRDFGILSIVGLGVLAGLVLHVVGMA